MTIKLGKQFCRNGYEDELNYASINTVHITCN